MKRKRINSLLTRLCLLWALVIFASSSWADTVFIGAVGAINGYVESTGTGWSASTAGSTAAGKLGSGQRFTSTTSATFTLKPTLAPSGSAPYIYRVLATRNTDTSASGNLVAQVAATGCSVAAGDGGATNKTTFFKTGGGAPLNTFKTIYTITLASGVTTPTIVFSASAAFTGRWYSDTYEVDQVLPCLNTPAITTIDWPLTNGQTTVTVEGVSATATSLHVQVIRGGNTLDMGTMATVVRVVP